MTHVVDYAQAINAALHICIAFLSGTYTPKHCMNPAPISDGTVWPFGIDG